MPDKTGNLATANGSEKRQQNFIVQKHFGWCPTSDVDADAAADADALMPAWSQKGRTSGCLCCLCVCCCLFIAALIATTRPKAAASAAATATNFDVATAANCRQTQPPNDDAKSVSDILRNIAECVGHALLLPWILHATSLPTWRLVVTLQARRRLHCGRGHLPGRLSGSLLLSGWLTSGKRLSRQSAELTSEVTLINVDFVSWKPDRVELYTHSYNYAIYNFVV